ncbi:MAG: radical SAM protein [Euryarchaeota archaeon]|nr:radical SAM protein [Euryarchaeota archaeon]
MAAEEDHLEFQLKRVDPEETLEEQFVRQKQTYLFYKLAWIQEFFDRKKLAQELAFLVMMIYIYDFIDRLGMRFADRILNFLSFTSWPLEKFRPLMGLNLEAKIALAVAIEYPEKSQEEQEKIVELVTTAYAWLGLGREQEWEVAQVVKRKRWLYSLLNSEPERKRRELIERLREQGGKRAEFRLVNVGIVPTELCPNSCRFCLAAWKASCEERIGRSIEEEEFEVIADEVINFAGERGLIVTVTGGEPFLELERVLYLVRHARSRLDITTSAYWARDVGKAREILSKLSAAARENRNEDFHFTLQVSLDAFHQEVRFERGEFVQNVPIECVLNLLKLTQEEFPEIEVVLLTKLTSYEDPLARLIKLLEKQGMKVRITRKVTQPGVTVNLLDEERRLVTKPALLKAYLEFEGSQGKPVLIFYTVVESMGKASALDAFEFPGFREQVRELLKGKGEIKLPLIGIEVSDDGNVYPGAHALYAWSAGNVLEESLEDIFDRLCYDPLLIALAEEPAKIFEIAREVEGERIDAIAAGESSPLAAAYRVLEAPWMRLYITRRLLGEPRERAEEEYRKYKEEYRPE